MKSVSEIDGYEYTLEIKVAHKDRFFDVGGGETTFDWPHLPMKDEYISVQLGEVLEVVATHTDCENKRVPTVYCHKVAEHPQFEKIVLSKCLQGT